MARALRGRRVAVALLVAGLAVLAAPVVWGLSYVPLRPGPPPPPSQAPSLTPITPGVVRLAVIGDLGVANDRSRKVAGAVREACAERGCDAVLWLGDNLYPGGMTTADDPRMDQVHAPWRDVGAPIYPVLGNHDYDESLDRDRAAWQVAWAERTEGVHMPAPRYDFRIGDVQLVALDTTEVFWNGPQTHAAWLRELRERGAHWRVAFGHHNYLADGPHGNAGSYEGQSIVPYLSGGNLRALFEDELCGRFDLVIAGHEHTRQWIEACGTTWIVSGTGARPTWIVDRGNHPVFARSTPGFVWIELGAEAARFVFIDASGAVDFEGTRAGDGTVSVETGS